MGLAANYVREPKDSDVIGAYYRLLRVENNYAIVNGLTVPTSTIISEVYRDKAARDLNTSNAIAYHGVEASGVVTTTLDGYDKLAADLGVPNVEV